MPHFLSIVRGVEERTILLRRLPHLSHILERRLCRCQAILAKYSAYSGPLGVGGCPSLSVSSLQQPSRLSAAGAVNHIFYLPSTFHLPPF